MTDLQAQLQSTLGGAYTLERELGGGGMSRVFLAHEVRLGRKVVVKVLSPELAAGISAERFEREIRLAASLQQANIVPVLSTGETNGLPYYTMPFVEGESLRRRLGTQPMLSVTDTVRILGDVARALQFAHDRGIVHRDIKPDNVLLSGGTAVVTDFGIAKALSVSRTAGHAPETLTQLGTSIGTPAYMAPEQAAGDPTIDHRADIYAFGCMAYELLASHPPFHGRTPQRVLAAHMGEAPQSVATLRLDAPRELADLVMRCLAKDPNERPQNAADVLETLDAVTRGGAASSDGLSAFLRVMLVYVGSVIGVVAVAKAATITIGLPTWVLPGAFIVMALGLPVILFTGYVQSVNRRAVTRSPSGSRRTHGTMATLALKASPHVSWKRATRGGIYALGAFVALVVLFMGMRAFGIGPAGSLFGAGKLNQRDVVLVSDFGVSRADSSLASVVAEGVRANLAQSSSITLFNPTGVLGALRRMQLPGTVRLDLALARQLAQREGIKAIVTGDVTGLGTGYVIALRLVTADSGSVLAAYQTTVDGPKDLVSGVDDVTRKLRGKIGESLKSVQASPALEQVTTSSYEALRAYTEGTRAFDLERDFPKAIPLLQRAVALDTGFATAWRKLGTAYSNAHHPSSEVDFSLTKAFQFRARLSENERFLTEAYYYYRGPGHDRQRAIVAYQALLDRGDSVYAANNLAIVYNAMQQTAKAESLFRLAIRKNPDNLIPVPNLAGVLLTEGKRAQFDSMIAVDLKRAPGNPNLVDLSLSPMYLDRQYDRYEHAIDSVRRAAPSPEMHDMAAWRGSLILEVRGRLNDAERRFHESIVESVKSGSASPVILDSTTMALFDAWFRNRPERAVQRIDAAVAANPLSALAERDRPLPDLATAYAVAGRPDRAQALLAQFAQLKDTAYVRSRAGDVHAALAEVAIAEKRPRDAIAEFRRSDKLPDGYSRFANSVRIHAQLGRAFDLANEPDSAIAELEAFLHAPFGNRMEDDAIYLAGALKRLGELYDAKGDREKATAHLTAFVGVWKNADPELQPAVADAKKRLARLASSEKR